MNLELYDLALITLCFGFCGALFAIGIFWLGDLKRQIVLNRKLEEAKYLYIKVK